MFALPGRLGDPYSKGCNALIRDQIAKLVTTPEEVLADLEIQWKSHEDQQDQLALALRAPEIPLSAEEAKVLNYLTQHSDAIVDDISLKTGIPMHKLNSLLLGMSSRI